MILSKVRELCLINSVISPRKWGFRNAILIILSSFTGLLLVLWFFCLCDNSLLTESDVDGIKKTKKYLKI